MDGFTKLIKKKLVDQNNDNFVTAVADLLGVSQSTASRKMSGEIAYTFEEISFLTIKLGFTADELVEISREAAEKYLAKD